MSRVRILFLGTPEFAVTCLERLIADNHFEIAAVVTQPDRPAGRKMQLKASPVKEIALRHGLTVFSPETVNTQEFREQIAQLGCESAVVVAFGQILGTKFLELFPRKAVNVHGSLLPRWRGAAPIQRSLMAGDRESGVALQIVVKKLDAGPVLGIRKVTLTDEMDAASLYDQLKVLGADLLHVEYMDYLRGNLMPTEQDEAGVTIAPKLEKSEAKINWHLSARQVFNHIRGLALGPAAFGAAPSGTAVKFHQSRVVDGPGSGSPGEVVKVGPEGFQIACGDGKSGKALDILIVQPESRARQSAAEFLRGYPLKQGDQFT